MVQERGDGSEIGGIISFEMKKFNYVMSWMIAAERIELRLWSNGKDDG